MKRSSLPGPLGLIATAWKFCRKHPVLIHVFVWLFVVLPIAIDASATAAVSLLPQETDGAVLWPPTGPVYAVIFLAIAAILVSSWADACVLLVGRRMTVNAAGRARTSFLLLMRQARGPGLRLIGANIIRSCTIILLQVPLIIYTFLVLWRLDLLPTKIPTDVDPRLIMTHFFQSIFARAGTLPLIVILLTTAILCIPSIVYAIRTSLYAPALFQGKRSIREALRRSSVVVQTHIWHVIGSLCVLMFTFLLVPAMIMGIIADIAGPTPLPEIDFALNLLGTALMGFCWIMLLLCLSALFGALSKGRPTAVEME